MNSQEAWEKFIETGRVDYYLLSRGIDVYAAGYVRRPDSGFVSKTAHTGGESCADSGAECGSLEGGGRYAECDAVRNQ